MPESQSWTIGRLLEWTTGYLKSHDSDSPRLDAEVLLAHARGCQRIELYTSFDQTPTEEVLAGFRELVRRRAQGTPVAYLVGKREFYSLSFRVTPDVLIPRPETEFVVISLLDLAKEMEPKEPLLIADIGTGSGILAICAARLLPAAQVTAVDISQAALDVARLNASDHGVLERIEFLEGDLFSTVPVERRFDFVLSNPPYVTSAEMEQLPSTVRNHEPRGALEAGPRGTEVIERLIGESVERLLPGGTLVMEISPMLDDAVRALISADDRLELLPTRKDLAGLPRVAQARRR